MPKKGLLTISDFSLSHEKTFIFAEIQPYINMHSFSTFGGPADPNAYARNSCTVKTCGAQVKYSLSRNRLLLSESMQRCRRFEQDLCLSVHDPGLPFASPVQAKNSQEARHL